MPSYSILALAGLLYGSGMVAALPLNGQASRLLSRDTATYWQPKAGISWQIEIDSPLTTAQTTEDYAVFDIDLFDNDATTIAALHSNSRKVICYFSAGSYENWRPDASNFTSADYGNALDGWPGEYWLDTNCPNVRNIMTARLQLAVTKGCDGVDPDNVDAYDNNNGLGLTQADAVNYVQFLATTAHSLGLAVGLKNALEIVPQVIADVDYAVNEQCVQYSECDGETAFITAGKPVFHIEYPDSAPNVDATTKATICDAPNTQGFSTLLKEMSLNDWAEACPVFEQMALPSPAAPAPVLVSSAASSSVAAATAPPAVITALLVASSTATSTATPTTTPTATASSHKKHGHHTRTRSSASTPTA
jgi:hypothetical protein